MAARILLCGTGGALLSAAGLHWYDWSFWIALAGCVSYYIAGALDGEQSAKERTL